MYRCFSLFFKKQNKNIYIIYTINIILIQILEVKNKMTTKTQIIEENGGLDLFRENARMGNTIRQIARDLGVSECNLYAYLKEYGTDYTKIKKENPVLSTFEEKIEYDGGVEYLTVLAKNGFTLQEVAWNYGYCVESIVCKYLQKKGLTWTELKSR